MDKEKIQQIKGMLTEIEQFKESSNEMTIVSKDNILRVDGEVMAAMMSAAIIVLENQLDIVRRFAEAIPYMHKIGRAHV